MNFAVVGTGVVGTALAVKLEQGGFRCIGVHTRSKRSYQTFSSYMKADHKPLSQLTKEADLIFITTQDGMIETAAKNLAENWQGKERQTWIHCSGALSSEILYQPHLPIGYLSLHPIQAFANVDVALKLLPGTHFGIEGTRTELGIEIVKVLGGVPHVIDTKNKAVYHAGAVVASNYLVTLARIGVNLLKKAGIDEKEGLISLIPLMKGTIANLETTGLPLALTGPIVRGDWEVLKKHLSMMDEEEKIYRLLGMETLKIAEAKWKELGVSQSDEVLAKLKEVLQESD